VVNRKGPDRIEDLWHSVQMKTYWRNGPVVPLVTDRLIDFIIRCRVAAIGGITPLPGHVWRDPARGETALPRNG
jgi:hypothetical protein